MGVLLEKGIEIHVEVTWFAFELSDDTFDGDSVCMVHQKSDRPPVLARIILLRFDLLVKVYQQLYLILDCGKQVMIANKEEDVRAANTKEIWQGFGGMVLSDMSG